MGGSEQADAGEIWFDREARSRSARTIHKVQSVKMGVLHGHGNTCLPEWPDLHARQLDQGLHYYQTNNQRGSFDG